MKRKLGLFVILFFLTGCAKLAHLEELLKLKDLSDDREQQDLYVKTHDENFERLLDVAKNNSLDQFPSKKRFLNAFGTPLFSEQVSLDGESVEKWVYRYATQAFGSPKVYVYFEKSGKLKSWKYFSREELKEEVPDVPPVQKTQIQTGP